ncbi:hypothetical protein DL768_005856 [Monosporascus sp. mg162]|nr:hypothetical protein DL768_005856 [Monosporascus sp. mg162]
MRLTTLFLVVAASSALGLVAPGNKPEKSPILKRLPEVEKAGASGADDDDAIAYAWFAEDEVDEKREIEAAGASGEDDDDAIAYAWFAEDEVDEKREVEAAGASGEDDDDAIAYAWFAEDEE